ncbi:hypothetical protein [Erythrobacter sp. QSSC1-22B]|uniref:hypothetical protein n=1 Tax=Erythrobacter sp. QSSC1-22B TaxID=1860125 RepID=UPI0011A77F3D|nr:hypothetical protein [Erythrobacter sp. QSSC1-22B]
MSNSEALVPAHCHYHRRPLAALSDTDRLIWFKSGLFPEVRQNEAFSVGSADQRRIFSLCLSISWWCLFSTPVHAVPEGHPQTHHQSGSFGHDFAKSGISRADPKTVME